MGDVGVAELNCVRVEVGLGLLINELIAALVVEGWTNIETLARAEFPKFLVVGIGVDEKSKTLRSNRSGVVVVGDMEVLPGRMVGNKSGLVEKVEDEIGFWEQIVPKVVSKGQVKPFQDV